jgi:hypothetical protein
VKAHAEAWRSRKQPLRDRSRAAGKRGASGEPWRRGRGVSRPNEPLQWLSEIRVDPAFDPLRSDPRYDSLLQRMNIVL